MRRAVGRFAAGAARRHARVGRRAYGDRSQCDERGDRDRANRFVAKLGLVPAQVRRRRRSGEPAPVRAGCAWSRSCSP